MVLKKINTDVWIGVVLILWSVWWYVLAGDFGNSEAELWPKGVLGLIILLSGGLIFGGIRKTMRAGVAQESDAKIFLGPMGCIIAIIVYALSMEQVGFFAATAVFCPLSMLALGYRNWKGIISITAGLNIFVYFLFVMQLQLQMP